jgi:hypothetical protein
VASDLSVGSGVIVIFVIGAHLTASAPFRAGPLGPYPAGYPKRPAGGQVIRLGFPLPFGRRHSLLGHPVPAGELGPPHGRLTEPRFGPRRGFRVPHTRAATGVGALCAPGTTVLIPAGATSRPASAASQRTSPCTPPHFPSAGIWLTRHLPRVHTCSPVRSSPRLWPPGWNGPPLGQHPGLRTQPTKSQTTHAEEGTGHRARTWNYTLNSQFRRSPIR